MKTPQEMQDKYGPMLEKASARIRFVVSNNLPEDHYLRKEAIAYLTKLIDVVALEGYSMTELRMGKDLRGVAFEPLSEADRNTVKARWRELRRRRRNEKAQGIHRIGNL
jgi:hypothetical protein